MSAQTTDAAEFLEALVTDGTSTEFPSSRSFTLQFCLSSQRSVSVGSFGQREKRLFPRCDHDASGSVMVQTPASGRRSHNVHSALEPSLWACRSWTQKQYPRHGVRTDSLKLHLGYASKQHSARTDAFAILMTFPEDFAGHVSHGPASPWALEDFRSLQQHASEVQRYAVYLCRFAGTEQRRAVGLLQEGYTGWPTHVMHASQLQYTGPLPRSCPCVTQHMPMRGTASGQEFNSTQQQTLGVKFWLRFGTLPRQNPFPGMAVFLSWSLSRLLRFNRSQPQRSLGLRCTEPGLRDRSHESLSEITQTHRL